MSQVMPPREPRLFAEVGRSKSGLRRRIQIFEIEN